MTFLKLTLGLIALLCLMAAPVAHAGDIYVSHPNTSKGVIRLCDTGVVDSGSGLPVYSAAGCLGGPGSALQTMPIHAEATPRSSTITAGGTAQDLMAANTARNGWQIQNQSNGDLYIRSKGAGGATVATQDQNSIVLHPNDYYLAPYVSTYAWSIVGATTGQAFNAGEW